MCIRDRIYKEHAALTKDTTIDISDLNYDILKEKRSVQCAYITYPGINAGANHGTPRLFTDKKFYTPSQKAQRHTFDDINQSESVDETHPLISVSYTHLRA